MHREPATAVEFNLERRNAQRLAEHRKQGRGTIVRHMTDEPDGQVQVVERNPPRINIRADVRTELQEHLRRQLSDLVSDLDTDEDAHHRKFTADASALPDCKRGELPDGQPEPRTPRLLTRLPTANC